MRAALVLLVALMAAPLAAPLAAPPAAAQAELFAAVDAWVLESMERAQAPGGAVAIVKDGEIAHARGYGAADPSGRAVTPQTPFFVMSVTKAFTSHLILQLAEERKLAFDDPVRRHLPWFEVADASGGEITLRHLLTHTSGLPTIVEGEYDRLLAPARADDLEREVRRLRDTRLSFAPGERYQYSNVGYATLALVIESIEGRSYEDAIEARIFAPLGMAHAHARKADAVADGLATGHRSWWGRPVPFDWDHSRISVGAGFTYASVDDLARFAAMNLGGGALSGTRLATPEGIAQLHARAVEVPSPAGGKGYAMGWFVESLHGRRLVHHAGDGPNFHAELLLLPEEGYAVALVLNKNDVVDPGPIVSLAPGIASLLLGHEPEPRASGGALATARTTLVAIDVALLLLIVWVATRFRAAPRPGRAGRALVGALGALLWAALTLYVAPAALWPLRGLWLSAPDVALVLTMSGALAILLAGIALAHGVRAWRARA